MRQKRLKGVEAENGTERFTDLGKLKFVKVVRFQAQANFCYCPSCLKKRHSLQKWSKSTQKYDVISLCQAKSVTHSVAGLLLLSCRLMISFGKNPIWFVVNWQVRKSVTKQESILQTFFHSSLTAKIRKRRKSQFGRIDSLFHFQPHPSSI